MDRESPAIGVNPSNQKLESPLSYPLGFRRNRLNPLIRDLVADVTVRPEKLMQPLFVVESLGSDSSPTPHRESLLGLPQVYRDSPHSLLKQIESDLENGVNKFLLFGVPKAKSKDHFSGDFTAQQIFEIKMRFGTSCVLAVDVCLCSSTVHGQCGVLNDAEDHVHNSGTVEVLTRLSLEYASAGADIVAPSDMMDGRIASIRQALDRHHLERTILLSYSAKFHSSFYGPFRNAAESAPKTSALKDRATYQIDPRNSKDAERSSLRDLNEGADWLMVKPGMPYLDIIKSLTEKIPVPWCVYEVSGEYAAIESLAEKGLINGPRAHLEAWTAFFRAGASFIITYGARSARKYLAETF